MTKLLKPESKVLYVSTDADVDTAIAQLSDFPGALAVDTERAGTYRYDDRAYLIQLKRSSSSIYLVDPVDISDDAMDELAFFMNQLEWILHDATQDMPCLLDLGMRPDSIFDTGLAAQLLNRKKLGLAALCEELLGVELAKEHSNVDWSTRPLQTSWLMYAALDVEFLPELQKSLTQHLKDDDKWDIAQEEFAELAQFTPPSPLDEPWRKLHGIGNLKTGRELAIAQSIWTVRDKIAKSRDVAPFTLIKDREIVSLAKEKPRSVPETMSILRWPSRRGKEGARWLGAVKQGYRVKDLPQKSVKGSGMPAPRLWKTHKEQQYRRYKTAQLKLAELSDELDIPVANLIQPATLKKFFWKSGNSSLLNENADSGISAVEAELVNFGARLWQIEETADLIYEAIEAPLTLDEIEQEQASVTSGNGMN